jgi:hypothetical protein
MERVAQRRNIASYKSHPGVLDASGAVTFRLKKLVGNLFPGGIHQSH